jgi:hypothetical protein
VNVTASKPGQETYTRSTMSWVAGRSSGESLLVITELGTSEEIPCTYGDYDERSAECRHRFQCSMATRVYTVDQKEWNEVTDDLKQIKRKQPALARLPANREGETEKACRRLAEKLGEGKATLCGTTHPAWKKPKAPPAKAASPAAPRAAAPTPATPAPQALPAGCPPLDLAPVSAARQAEARRRNSAGMKRHAAADYKGAIEQFTAALRANPGHLLARYNLACACSRNGQGAAALARLAELRRCSAGEGGAACAKILRSARSDQDLESIRAMLPLP